MQELALEDAGSREPSRKWQWLFQMVGFLGLVGVTAAAVMYLPVFKLEDISIAGNPTYISAEDICRIAGVYKGQHMFQVETDKAAQNLLRPGPSCSVPVTLMKAGLSMRRENGYRIRHNAAFHDSAAGFPNWLSDTFYPDVCRIRSR